MPRRRDPGFLERWSPLIATSKAVPAAFVTIARTFEQIDRVMLDEIKADVKERSDSRFRTDQLLEPRDRDVTSYIRSVEEGASRASSEADVAAYLSDYSCIIAWGWVHSALLERQGHSNHHYMFQWTQAKSRANELLDLARAVLETYDSDECRALLVPGREGVGASIEAKLRKLCSFNTIYCRPTYDNGRSQSAFDNHSFHELFEQFIGERREIVKAKRKANYVRVHQNVSKDSA